MESKGRDSSADVGDLGRGIFELARTPLALPEGAMVKGEGGVAPPGERLCIRARSLFLDARQRAGRHQRRAWSARRQIEKTDQSVAVAIELKVLVHCRVLAPGVVHPLTSSFEVT